MQKSIKRLALGITLALIIGAFLVSRQKSLENPPRKEQSVATAQAEISPAPKRTQITVAPFLRHFGSELDLKFSSDHRLVRIRSSRKPGVAARTFQSGDYESVRKRSQEILDQVKSLIAYNPDFPVGENAIRSDEVSSQIEFTEKYRGVPLAPFGGITVQLDQNGGIRGLYSTYISEVRISNEASMDETEARELAPKKIHFSRTQDTPVGKGELILFTPGPQDSEQPVELKYAYRYSIDGRDVILDASNGNILSERDRRQF